MKKILINKLLKSGKFIVTYKDEKRKKVLQLIKQIKQEDKISMTYGEASQIFSCINSVIKVEGDIAEVGVFKGGSARLICEAKGDKNLHLFDTFEGLPEISEFDNNKYYKEKYTCDLENVKDYLKEYENINYYKGIFPATSESIKDKRFSFVHLDLDIYQSTLDSLKFFYDKMNKGGIIITHDYTLAKGVKTAFDNFFKDKPEPIIILNNSQGMVVKI